jgi:hypothetical protein
VIKAKIEAITAGIATVDEEFLAYIVILGTTSTVIERVGPELARSYEITGYTPMLALPGGQPEPDRQLSNLLPPVTMSGAGAVRLDQILRPK